jgi:hypothetical protein
MAQPKQTQGRPRKEVPDSRLDALRELLGKAVMLPSDRLREALDDAVRRGRMTRDDAEELYQSLMTTGRRQVEDVLADLEQLVGRSRSGLARVTGLGKNFPIADYDELAAGQVTQRLEGLSPADLRKVRDYERRHANRKTVLNAVERRLG